jgi:hypothetical protein
MRTIYLSLTPRLFSNDTRESELAGCHGNLHGADFPSIIGKTSGVMWRARGSAR